MSLASLLTMRCTVRRNESSADAYGGKATPHDFQVVSVDTPCFLTVETVQEVLNGKEHVAVEKITGHFRKGADIKRGDRVEDVQDRRGQDVLEGKLEVMTVTEHSLGAGVALKEAALRRIR